MRCMRGNGIVGGERYHIPSSRGFQSCWFVFCFSNFLTLFICHYYHPSCFPFLPTTSLVLAPVVLFCLQHAFTRCTYVVLLSPLNRPFELMAHSHGPVSPLPPSHCLQTSQIPDSSMAVYRVWNNHPVNYAKNEISIMRSCSFVF